MRRRGALVLAALVAVVLLALAILWKPGQDVPPGPATGLRVVVVAVDGMDGFLVTRYMAEGKMPTMSRLLRRAATAEVSADRPVVPEVGWTRVVRGRALTETELATAGAPGDNRLFSVAPDLARAVLDAGGRAVVVGWPSTWPVEDGPVLCAAPYAPERTSHSSALAPALFLGGPGQATAGLEGALEAAVERSEAALESEFARAFPEGTGGPDWAGAVASARWSLLADLTSVDLAARLIAEGEPHLALVYLGGLDAVCHSFLAAAMPDYFPTELRGAERFEGVAGAYYAFVDSAIERLARLGDDRTLIVVCSAYGTHPVAGGATPSVGHDQGAPGVFVLHGRTVSSTPVPLQISTLDVAPTLLAALGVPIPSDMDGRVVVEALPPGLLEQFPPAYVKPRAHGREGSAPAAPSLVSEMERLAEERLATLGAGAPR